MKKLYWILIILSFVLLLLIILGNLNKKNSAETKNYSDKDISFGYPSSWKDAKTSDKSIFFLKTGNGCVLSAAKYPAPDSLMKKHLALLLNATNNGNYLNYKINNMFVKTKLFYCDYQTYAISSACQSANINTSYIDSAHCVYEKAKTFSKTGLIPIPENDNSSKIIDSIKESRQIGAETLSWYLNWKDIYNNTDLTDMLITPLSYEGKTVILIPIIYTNQLGQFPSGFKDFRDSGFKEAFADFSVDFVNRYHPEYYLIGGEVDDYLYTRREQISDYKDFFIYVRDEIHKSSPNTKVGIVFTYHDAKNHNAFDIIKELGKECDVIVYTVHAYENDFDYSNQSREIQYIEEASKLIPNKPYAIIESGWSSSEMLGSNEKKQAEVVKDYFNFIKNPSNNPEFIIWFGLHEGKDCTQAANVFIMNQTVSPEFRMRFEEFMCSLGLKKYDDTPKKAYEEWLEESGKIK